MQRWLIAVAVVAGLAVVAISLGMRAQPRSGAVEEAKRISLHPERTPKPVARGRSAPSPLLTGGNLSARLEALRGRPVVLDAWASWCPPCREELPLLATAATHFGGRVAFLGADVEDDSASARDLLAEVPLGYPSYATSLDDLRSLSPAPGVPFTLFIGRDGQVEAGHIGAYRSQQELTADLSSLLHH